VPTSEKGWEGLLCWAEGFGPVKCAGIEGTSSYGAGLIRHLRENYRDLLTRLSAALSMTEAAYLEARRRRDL
jgi:hypothetical protein